MSTYVVSVTRITEDGEEVQLEKEIRVEMPYSKSVKKIVKEALEKGEVEDNLYAY